MSIYKVTSVIRVTKSITTRH